MTIIISIGGSIFGVYQYKKNQLDRRKDTLLPLTEEFDKNMGETLQLAKRLLEEFEYAQPNEKNEIEIYSLHNLDIFRHHSEVEGGYVDTFKIEIRDSMDALLNFFGKLGYLLNMNLIKEDEIEYFRDFIEKAANSESIGLYTEKYDFPLYKKLLEKLNLTQKKPS